MNRPPLLVMFAARVLFVFLFIMFLPIYLVTVLLLEPLVHIVTDVIPNSLDYLLEIGSSEHDI